MRIFILCFAFLFAFALPSFAQPSNDGAALYGPWRGIWTGSGQPQAIYQGEMSLNLGAENEVTGQIDWMLVQTAVPEIQNKIGAHGVEYVEGVFDPVTRSIYMHGTRLDDPSQILGVDVYRLVLGDNNAVMVGVTADGDTWNGRIEFSR